MSYILIGLPMALLIWIIGCAFFARSARAPSLLRPEEPESPPPNRFIPPDLQRKIQLRRNLAAAARAKAELSAPTGSRRTRADIRAELRRREGLKAGCLALLDAAAIEHPAGHSSSVARYILRSQSDDRIELMFEKTEKSRANLWLAQGLVGDLVTADIAFRIYPASALYKAPEPGGKQSYGRHAALKPMRSLAHADLVRFTIDRTEQLERVLEHLAGR